MKINDSNSSNQALNSSQAIGKTNSQAKVKPAVSVVDENNQANQSKNLNQEKARFEVNEKAIALFEEQSAIDSTKSSSSLAVQGGQNSSGYKAKQSQNSQYDQPSQQNLSAVAAYESVDSIAQKENIKQVFGVSLFA